MAYLEKFSDREVDLLVSLPYRAGLWVSSSDKTGGVHAQSEEIHALESIILEKSKSGFFESAFVHEVMVETYSRKEDWPEWVEDIDDIIEDCFKAVKLITRTLSENDVDAYKRNIMFISMRVAKAFREFDTKASSIQRLLVWARIKVDTIIGLFTGKRFESQELLNISYDEDIALSELANALQIKA